MVISYILFFLGLFLLVKGANWIVDSASSIAKRIGVSSLVIGLTVVSLGTTLPELAVNLFASFSGSSEIVFGNIIGSNVSNILLILGMVAMIKGVRLRSETIWGEIPFALLAAFVLFVLTGNLFSDKTFLTRNDGLILISLFVVFLYYIYQVAKKDNRNFSVNSIIDSSSWKITLKLIFGIVGIYFGGKLVVDGAIFIAGQLGLSEYLISATIIAIGTSLPELVVSIVAVTKGNPDLAVGNIVGSSILNIFWVLGIVPVLSPLAIPAFVGVDIAIMFLATLLLFALMFTGGNHELKKRDGGILLLFYVLYLLMVIVRG
jgi:cation:H+ antiporter